VTPQDFANLTLGAPRGMTDDECSSLRVQCDGTQTLSRWALTWRERVAVLFGADVWLCVLAGNSQPPVWLVAKRGHPGE